MIKCQVPSANELSGPRQIPLVEKSLRIVAARPRSDQVTVPRRFRDR